MSPVTLELKLQGRSGCYLAILEKGANILVRKYSGDPLYNKRLLLQAEKQKVFNSEIEFILAPKVINIHSENTAYFDMQYVAGSKYSEHFLNCSISEIITILDRLIIFIDKEFNNCKYKYLPKDIFLNKVNSIKTGLKDELAVSRQVDFFFDYLQNNIPEVPMPIGSCHGDLTFSNMIFRKEKIFLLDFLDSFIETPLLDIVKLRQDTSFGWTLMLDKDIPEFQKNKILQVLKYFDVKLHEYFKENEFYKNWYIYLQMLNLMRILPYLKDAKEIEFIIKCLEQISSNEDI